eukprot:10363946-Lingulodinium_polyedra.AAC.1
MPAASSANRPVSAGGGSAGFDFLAVGQGLPWLSSCVPPLAFLAFFPFLPAPRPTGAESPA